MCQKKGFFTIAAWQKADDLAVKVYEVTDPKTGYFPKHQLYSLTQQFRSAAVSVAANIAEGSGRESLAEYLHFLSIAKGSLAEVEYYIHLANRLTYLPSAIHQELEELQSACARALVGFIRFKQQELEAQHAKKRRTS